MRDDFSLQNLVKNIQNIGKLIGVQFGNDDKFHLNSLDDLLKCMKVLRFLLHKILFDFIVNNINFKKTFTNHVFVQNIFREDS